MGTSGCPDKISTPNKWKELVHKINDKDNYCLIDEDLNPLGKN